MNAKLLVEEEQKIANLEIEELKKKKLSKVGNIWEKKKKSYRRKKTKSPSKCNTRSNFRKVDCIQKENKRSFPTIL